MGRRPISDEEKILEKNGRHSYIKKLKDGRYRIAVRRKIKGTPKYGQRQITVRCKLSEAKNIFRKMWEDLRGLYGREYMDLINQRDSLMMNFNSGEIKMIKEIIEIERRLG